MDNHQFVKTGPDLSSEELTNSSWNRAPYLPERSIPGVFAVGDARAGSVKRVASAVGEGLICAQADPPGPARYVRAPLAGGIAMCPRSS